MFDFLSKAGSSVMDGLSSVGSSVADGVQSGLAHTFEKLQDPEFMQQAGLMSSALSNDQNRYQSALNSYDARRQEIARQKREDMQRAQAREQQIADRDEGRAYNEQQGYLSNFTPESVQAFRESGDQSVLVKKPVKMEFRREEGRDGHTYEVQVDPQTGLDIPDGVRRVVDYAEAKAPKQSRTQLINGILFEEFGPNDWRPVAGGSDGKGAQIDTSDEGITLADGSYVNRVGMHRMQNGDLVNIEKVGGKLKATTPTKAMRDQYEANNTAADETLVNDLKVLKGGADNGYVMSVVTGTGGDVGKPATGADTASKYSRWNPLSDDKDDDALRNVVVSGQRLNQAMENMGIAQAKAMGASGINTAEEAARFGASMPKVDYSSTAAYKNSLKAIETYVGNYNAKNAKHAPATDTSARQGDNPPPRYPDGTVLEKGGKKYVVKDGKPVLQ